MPVGASVTHVWQRLEFDRAVTDSPIATFAVAGGAP